MKSLMPKAVNNNVVSGVSEKPGNNIVICQTKLGAVVANKPSDKNHQVRIRSKCGTPHDEDPFRTRFQWIAYNVDTKEFSGTGGGNPQALLVLERVNWIRS